jgi:hypothetical protein
MERNELPPKSGLISSNPHRAKPSPSMILCHLATALMMCCAMRARAPARFLKSWSQKQPAAHLFKKVNPHAAPPPAPASLPYAAPPPAPASLPYAAAAAAAAAYLDIVFL